MGSLKGFRKKNADKTARVLIVELFDAVRLVVAIGIGVAAGFVIDLMIFAVLQAGERVTHHKAPKMVYDINSMISYGVIISSALAAGIRHLRNNWKLAKHRE